MTHFTDEKESLRRAIDERLKRMTEKEKNAESRSLCRRLLELLPADTKKICAFYPMYSEVQIKDFLEEVLKRDLELYLPAFENKLIFRRATDLTSLVVNKTIKVPEPPQGSETLQDGDEAIVIVPGRAFTKDGNRMGRGNGGYDIWIRAKRKLSPTSQFWGVCYECQIVHELPMEAHDEKVDLVVTARGKVATMP